MAQARSWRPLATVRYLPRTIPTEYRAALILTLRKATVDRSTVGDLAVARLGPRSSPTCLLVTRVSTRSGMQAETSNLRER
ncbi:MAG: hypothetical protein JWP97_5388 [Labilithrix sp.]|nr:hypothetical protein [Labilithrix sp.]